MFANEAEYQEALARYLAYTGWDVQVEVQFENEKGTYWRIDILATKDDKKLLIEAKDSAKKVNQAIDQLKRYAPYFPGADLWFACPDDIDPTNITKLVANGVQPIPTASLNLERYADLATVKVKGKIYHRKTHAVAALPHRLKPWALPPLGARICMKPGCGGKLKAIDFKPLYECDIVEQVIATAECRACKQHREVLVTRFKELAPVPTSSR